MPIRHVLVVDDSKSARLMLRKILQNLGMTVDTADSAEEALEYLRNKKPDVIFMDHTMPGMDGLTALRQIRREPATATIPAAMYTSKDEPAYRNEAHAAGAVDVLSKPATPEALGALLERMNALLDAAVNPSTAGPVAGGGEGVTAEWVEKLFLEKAERTFYDAVESQVLPLINDVIAKLRLELELSQEEASSRIAAQVVDKRLANWQPPAPPVVDTQEAVEAALASRLPTLLDERLETFRRDERMATEQQIQETAKQICQSQLRAFTEQLAPQLNQRVADMVRKGGDAVQEAATAAAREIAWTGAREAALQAVAEARAASVNVEETPAAAAARVAGKMLAEVQGEWRLRLYLAAGAAALAGIGAALLAYGLK